MIDLFLVIAFLTLLVQVIGVILGFFVGIGMFLYVIVDVLRTGRRYN
jgi:hypothetical protein